MTCSAIDLFTCLNVIHLTCASDAMLAGPCISFNREGRRETEVAKGITLGEMRCKARVAENAMLQAVKTHALQYSTKPSDGPLCTLPSFLASKGNVCVPASLSFHASPRWLCLSSMPPQKGSALCCRDFRPLEFVNLSYTFLLPLTLRWLELGVA